MGRVTRHFVLFFASLLTAAAFYRFLDTDSLTWALSMASAYASLVLLALSLAIGPWNRLRGLPNPTSGYFRRDVGIWAGVLGLFHVVVGLQVHMGGKFWLYFVPPEDARVVFPLRLDAFGLANHTGLGAALILLMLLVISNDASLRALGKRRWKSLQRWNYLGAALVVAHGIVYEILEKRTKGFVLAGAAIVLLALALQAAGFRAARKAAK